MKLATFTFANDSPLTRRHWGIATMPVRRGGLPPELALELDDGRRFRVVTGATVGIKTVIRADLVLEGHELVTGRLVDDVLDGGGVVVDAEGRTRQLTGKPEPFESHKWSVDDIAEMIPQIGILRSDLAGGDAAAHDLADPFVWSELIDVRVVDESPAHKWFRIHQRLPGSGLHFTLWVELLHRDPVARFVGRIVWSDPSDPRTLRQFSAIVWRCGEYAAFDYATRNGIQAQLQHGREWRCLLNTGPITFGDGMALPLSGQLLAFDSAFGDSKVPPADPADFSDEDNRSMANLQAALVGGSVWGVCHDWDGGWLACDRLPSFGNNVSPAVLAAADLDSFRRLLQEPRGWFADRPFGLGRYPGQTGNQADFGATKGSALVVGRDPRLIPALRYGAHGDLLRCYTHYELDGRPLNLDEHPDFVTWSGVNHYDPRVSKDRRGKSVTLPVPAASFFGIDDEHASRNYQAAYLALVDDPMMVEQLQHVLTIDRAAYRQRFPQFGEGASRAQGRTAGAWAQLACVADQDTAEGFAALAWQRMQRSAQTWAMNVAGPMRVPEARGPDPRKAIFDEAGALTSWCSMWELGLFIVGAAKAAKHERAIEGHARVALVTACRTIAAFGCFLQGGAWHTVHDIRWKGGDAVTLQTPSREVTCEPGTGGVGLWTFAGLVVARAVLREELAATDPLRMKLEDYVRTVTGNKLPGHGLQATSPLYLHEAAREAAEWLAAAPPLNQ